jgi:predicted nucleotidyltransferase
MATSTASKEEIARLIARFAAEQPDVMAAYLFGSAVQNRLTADSDVDIGLLFEPSPNGIQLLELQEDLTTLLKRQADLVDLNHVSPILGMQVLKHGEIVFERSERAAREFQVRTLFAYFDLKQVRKPIEEALLSS